MIRFDKESHEYFDGEKPLISVTQLLRKHGLAPDYSRVSKTLLEKSAERGNRIHEEVEALFKDNAEPASEEGLSVRQWLSTRELSDVSCENIVWNDIVAGTYDILCSLDGELTLMDIKTTSTRQSDYWTWQLSLYAYLLEQGGVHVQRMGDLWLHDGRAEWCMTLPKPTEEVERLLECERAGSSYLAQLDADEDALVRAVSDDAKAIMEAEAFIKEAKARVQDGYDKILAEMERRGAKSVEGHGIRITYVSPQKRVTFDSKAFKADHPEYDGRYDKTSEVKASLRVTKV